MKYYSESLKALFDSEDELKAAEDKAVAEETAKREAEQKRSAERKARAAEVDEARKALAAATEKYCKVLSKFCEDYGAYHCSISPCDLPDVLDSEMTILAQMLGLI